MSGWHRRTGQEASELRLVRRAGYAWCHQEASKLQLPSPLHIPTRPMGRQSHASPRFGGLTNTIPCLSHTDSLSCYNCLRRHTPHPTPPHLTTFPPPPTPSICTSPRGGWQVEGQGKRTRITSGEQSRGTPPRHTRQQELPSDKKRTPSGRDPGHSSENRSGGPLDTLSQGRPTARDWQLAQTARRHESKSTRRCNEARNFFWGL